VLAKTWAKFTANLAKLWAKVGRLAFAGILAFALCSVYAIAQLFMSRAKHPHPIYFAPAAFVEIVTAIAVWQIVEMFHKWSRSNQTNQDKRFYGVLITMLIVLILPSITTSVTANYWEFGGFIPNADVIFPILLGSLFPLMLIVCAILGAIPEVVKRRKASLQKPESVGKETTQKTTRVQRALPTAKRREKVFALLCENLDQSPADLGKRFGVTAQTIRNDFGYLAKQGKIIYKDGRVSLRPQKVIAKP
jgi:NADH:ubiquinone oxidoreductase subunit 5 (subunit L)/multisubunit Na+/H+ antiporter MnhA subunit